MLFTRWHLYAQLTRIVAIKTMWLYNELRYYGILHRWFTSYLSNCKQLVSTNNHSSSFMILSMVTLKGSILGPLLFFLYISDIPLCPSIWRFILFADDTSILFRTKEKSITSFFNYQYELKIFCGWFRTNKLSLNVKWTNFTIFQNWSRAFSISINTNEHYV